MRRRSGRRTENGSSLFGGDPPARRDRWRPSSGRCERMGRRLGGRRRAENPAAVFTSDLHRAVETAELAFGGTGIPIYQEPRLRECNYGALNGTPVAQLEAVRLHHVDEPFPGGESYRQVVDRV